MPPKKNGKAKLHEEVKDLGRFFNFDEVLNTQIENKRITQVNGNLVEAQLLWIVKATVDAIFREMRTKHSSSPHLDYLNKLLQDNESIYQKLIRAKLLNIIRTRYNRYIMLDLPIEIPHLKVRITRVKAEIKKYSLREQQGIDKDAILCFFKKCIFMYRFDLNKQPLEQVLQLLNRSPEFRRWVSAGLVDPATRKADELWNSGNHEWLLRKLIVQTIKRSAGMENDIIPYVFHRENQVNKVVDWLTIHNEVRSPVKRLYFWNQNNKILSGHTPAIRSRKTGDARKGTKTTHSKEFHDKLEDAFNESTSPREFMRKVRLISHRYLHSGKRHLTPSNTTYFTVEGTKTSDEKAINELRHSKMIPAFTARYRLMLNFSNWTKRKTDGDDVESPSSTSTEYTP